jgi:hypothetical protein
MGFFLFMDYICIGLLAVFLTKHGRFASAIS